MENVFNLEEIEIAIIDTCSDSNGYYDHQQKKQEKKEQRDQADEPNQRKTHCNTEVWNENFLRRPRSFCENVAVIREAVVVKNLSDDETYQNRDSNDNINKNSDNYATISVVDSHHDNELVAYCVLSDPCLSEVGIHSSTRGNSSPSSPFSCHKGIVNGIICDSGPLLTLLQTRCKEKGGAAITPRAFIVIPKIPLSPQGRKDYEALPKLKDCISLSDYTGLFTTTLDDNCKQQPGESERKHRPHAVPLKQYGASGELVAKHIIDCLNLQPCQQRMLTTTSTFAMLGGDSLSATRIVRGLYADHFHVYNTRFLGGEFGILPDERFSTIHLLHTTENLGQYVDFLDNHGIGCSLIDSQNNTDNERNNRTSGSYHNDENNTVFASSENNNNSTNNNSNDETVETEEIESRSDTLSSSQEQQLYDALTEAVITGMSHIAVALLEIGANPNFDCNDSSAFRLGKISGRINRKQLFRSTPLHLACLNGNALVVDRLLKRGAKFNIPDASGLFPLHLAASGRRKQKEQGSFDKERQELLLSDNVSTSVNLSTIDDNIDDDLQRLECVKLLVECGAKLIMKDGNKQTILHCAARGGHCRLLEYAITNWKEDVIIRGGVDKDSLDWTDRWFRTPVHWAILNGRVNALKVLLEMGCSPNPTKIRSNKRTSAAVESPIEMCNRLYGTSNEGIGPEIFRLLNNCNQV